MPTIRVSLQVTIDDVPIPSFPLYQRAAPTVVDAVSFTQISGGGFVAAQAPLTTIQDVILQSTQTVSVAFNGVVATPIQLTAGGVMLLMGTSLTALAISNASGQTTTLRGLVAGV